MNRAGLKLLIELPVATSPSPGLLSHARLNLGLEARRQLLLASSTVPLYRLLQAEQTSTMTPTTIAQISRLELQDLSAPLVATITDVKQLSSYNWIEAPSLTIAVPGTPPLWSAPSAPRQLKKDSGLIYIAQNAARHPDSPLEPLFRALCITNPSFDIR